MSIAIMATGDEIVHGDTLNTNGHELAKVLSTLGLPLGYHLSCSDKKQDIINGLSFLSACHHTLIIIGGLGPTPDDLTRFALSEFTKVPLETNESALEHIQSRLKNKLLNAGNTQQSLFPAKATLLPNPNGTAMGCCLKHLDKTYILLPGPPRECLPMFHQHVVPLLEKTKHSTKSILKWRIFGLAESEVAQQLEEALQGISCNTGYRLETPYIEFKVRCQPELISHVKKIIEPIITPHIISPVEYKASDLLKKYIYEQHQSLKIIDQATGGLLQCTLSTPETHSLLFFHEESKPMPCVHITGLEYYWKQKDTMEQSYLTLHYRFGEQVIVEHHSIPCRSSILLYAVEWLCFRILSLLNPVH